MNSYKTRTGRTLTDADIHALAEEIKASDYDVDILKKRSRRSSAMSWTPEAVYSTESAVAEQSRV